MTLYEQLDLIINILILLVTGIVAYLVYRQTQRNTQRQIDFEKERHIQEIRMRTYEDKRQLYHFASRMVSLATMIWACKPSEDTEEGIVVYYSNFFKDNIERYGLKYEEIRIFQDISQLVLEEDILIVFNMLCQNMRSIEIYVKEFYVEESIRNYPEAIENVKSIIRNCEEVRRLNIVDSLRERIRVDV